MRGRNLYAGNSPNSAHKLVTLDSRGAIRSVDLEIERENQGATNNEKHKSSQIIGGKCNARIHGRKLAASDLDGLVNWGNLAQDFEELI